MSDKPHRWTCEHCRRVGPWRDAWRWYPGFGEVDGQPLVYCSDDCNDAGFEKAQTKARA